MVDEVNVHLFLSENRCVLAFPTIDGQFDYKGFATTDDLAHQWCVELFQYYWEGAEERLTAPIRPVEHGRVSRWVKPSGTIMVVGQKRPEIDAQAVQDAVDNYEKVILSGSFNFGASSVLISKSVEITGEGRENDIPKTTIHKKGWSFPFRQFTGVFEIDENDVDVTIENLNFTDFNCTSIYQRLNTINSLKVLNNRITVPRGYGRGITYASFGDLLHGVLIQRVGKGGVLVEGNYIDLATGGIGRGALSRGGLEENPEYRPDLFNHEYYVGFGIAVNNCYGKVEIINNVVRNASGRGIALSGHFESAEVIIRENVVESEVYGAYPFSSRESSAGILAQTGFGTKDVPNYYVCIENNTIKLDKINNSGILVLGPVSEGSSKFKGGIIRDNVIILKNGYEGIHVRKCDGFNITGNKISGEVYYGIRVSGHRKFEDLDMSSIQNHLDGNDLQDLAIKAPDDYVQNHSDDKMFSKTEPHTAYIWLDRFTKNNKIHLLENETLIDKGEDNTIEYN